MQNSGIIRLVAGLLGQLDPDPSREGLIDTPSRVAKAWTFWTAGYGEDPGSVLKSFNDGAQNYDQMVFQGNIPLYSHCEHHLAPFFGVAHIGYIPNGRVVGLSKLARVVDIFARRLQVQERLTQQIAEALSRYLSSNVGVVLRCRHLCMESRGIQRPGTITYTSALAGNIRDNESARSEFLRFVELADAQTTKV